jgi:hypothetical protein
MRAVRPTSPVMTPLRVSLASLVAACTLLAVGCGGGSSTATEVAGEPISFEQLAQSASTSAEATSGRFAFDMSLTFPGADEPFAFAGEGAFDATAERASFAMDMSSFAKLLGGLVAGFGGTPGSADMPDFDDPDAWKIQVVQDGEVGYVRFPAIDDQLPEGKTWVRGTAGDVKAGGFDFDELESFTQSDPREVLDALRGLSGEIETVGQEELRGVETTHYRAVLDPAELAKRAAAENGKPSVLGELPLQDAVSEVPLDVWIDANGLVRKLSLDVSASDPSTAQSGSVSLAFELWDYGEPVAIEVPPASQVADASAVRG